MIRAAPNGIAIENVTCRQPSPASPLGKGPQAQALQDEVGDVAHLPRSPEVHFRNGYRKGSLRSGETRDTLLDLGVNRLAKFGITGAYLRASE
ncbi:MAG: hypothetical protein JO108_14190 [Acidobacteriaceae bacterium]|nr:hypothetical protein [Acidobacteriaceae bacterium]